MEIGLTTHDPPFYWSHLVDHCGDRLAAGEAELHDVGKLAVGVGHGLVVARD